MEQLESPIPGVEKLLAGMRPEVRGRALLEVCAEEATRIRGLDPGILALLERAAGAGHAYTHEIERMNEIALESEAFYFDQTEEGLRDEMAEHWFATARVATAFVKSQTDRTVEGAIEAARELAQLGPGESGAHRLEAALNAAHSGESPMEDIRGGGDPG